MDADARWCGKGIALDVVDGEDIVWKLVSTAGRLIGGITFVVDIK